MALSRARLGLYILGRREVFEACYELRPAFELLLQQRPDKLALSTGEMWPSTRPLTATEAADADADADAPPPAHAQEAVMEGVEHLGQFVFEMTSVRAQQLRAERGLLPAEGEGGTAAPLDPVAEGDDGPDYVVEDEDEEDDGEGDGDGDGDEDEDEVIADADADIEVGDVPKEEGGEGTKDEEEGGNPGAEAEAEGGA